MPTPTGREAARRRFIYALCTASTTARCDLSPPTASERALLKKLQDRTKTSQSGELTAMHRISDVLDLWEASSRN